MSSLPLVVAAFRSELPRAARDLGWPTLVVRPRTSWSAVPPELPGRGPVLLVGACGSLVDGPRRADLVVPREVRAASGQVLAPDPEWVERLLGRRAPEGRTAGELPDFVRTEPLWEAGAIVDDGPGRAALAVRTGASFVDLETAPLACAAAAAGRPWAVVRWVTDGPRHGLGWLPRLLGGWPGEDPSVFAVARGLLLRPHLLPPLLGLALANSRGRRRAGRALRRAAASTAWTPGGV
jgi:hypothetical protein